MDSGLGSDEDHKGRTKEQKQRRNQQLLSGCFIDAASLADENYVDQRASDDERRQGAVIFQSHFTMLPSSSNDDNFSSLSSTVSNAYNDDTSTPFNSIVTLPPPPSDNNDIQRKSPLGFYVDLNEMPDRPATPPPPTSAAKTKNIFSMVIDFEAAKKEKPTKFSSSISCNNNRMVKKQQGLLKLNVNNNDSSSSSINSIAGPSRQFDEEFIRHDLVVLDDDNMSSSSKSSNSIMITEQVDDQVVNHLSPVSDANNIAPAADSATKECNSIITVNNNGESSDDQYHSTQFVKLSDLECQKPRIDLNSTMSKSMMNKSIPESSWVESPLWMMSRSAGYRVAPHPLEPERHESHESSSSSAATDDSKPHSKSTKSAASRRLGTDLLRMFLEEIGPDCTIEVEKHRLRAHKCILASRCQYFAALLSGNCVETSGNIISLQGFSYESVYFALCHIYSGAAHVPDSISLVELASLADMLGLEGLKEVVEHALKQRHCHSFHRPCAGCCTGVLEVLPLSAAYGLDDLYQKCLQWITQYFVRVWPSRAFATLPRELREKCYQQHCVHMNAEKVLSTFVDCDKILTTLPNSRWAEPITHLVLQLIDVCHLYQRQNYAAILASTSFQALDGSTTQLCVQGQIIENQLLTCATNLSVEQACRSYSRCSKMCQQQSWSRPFTDLLYKIKQQLEQCLVKQANKLVRNNAWLRMDSTLRCRIKELIPTPTTTAAEPSSVAAISRLPRATSKRNSKQSHDPATTITNHISISSSDSSRNSSPGINQIQSRLMQNSNGSPSLRRSLLLAARAPQIPPSPTAYRRSSTLTQPTQSSAAKSIQTKSQTKPSQQRVQVVSSANKTMQANKTVTATTTIKDKQLVSKKLSSSSVKNKITNNITSVRKADSRSVVLNNKKPVVISRSGSPLKLDDNVLVTTTSSPKLQRSRVTSPMTKSTNNVLRKTTTALSTTKIVRNENGLIKTNNVNVKKKPSQIPLECETITTTTTSTTTTNSLQTMKRSTTFLKDEPTVIGKIV